MLEFEDNEPVVEVTSSDANVTFEIVNPDYGDLTETVTLFDYYVWVLGADTE